MNDNFTVSKNGTALIITLGRSLDASNAPALQDEMTKFMGETIEKVVFDASELLSVSSSGLRAIYFAKLKLGHQPEIVFVNCAKEIYDTLKMIGLASAIKFLKVENKKVVRSTEALEEFAANNDVVCYSMKMGQDYD